MHEAAKHAGAGKTFEVRARLAAALAEEFDHTDPKTLPY